MFCSKLDMMICLVQVQEAISQTEPIGEVPMEANPCGCFSDGFFWRFLSA